VARRQGNETRRLDSERTQGNKTKRRDSETKQQDGKTKRSGELRQRYETMRRDFFEAAESLKKSNTPLQEAAGKGCLAYFCGILALRALNERSISSIQAIGNILRIMRYRSSGDHMEIPVRDNLRRHFEYYLATYWYTICRNTHEFCTKIFFQRNER